MAALLLIDLQNDFMPGGPLPVRNAYDSVKAANDAQDLFNIIIASKDWHPENHLSFASMHQEKNVGDQITLCGLNQTLWPNHCVQNTRGAAFANQLDQSRIEFVVSKGEDIELDSYSAFFDNAHRHETALRSYLELKQVEDLFILGVATEYCVKYSAIDARKLGIKTSVIIDGCNALSTNPKDIENAKEEMRDHGVRLIKLKELYHERS